MNNTQVRRGAELSADHHLVVSWIRWLGSLPDRPGKPKRVIEVNGEHLAEAPVRVSRILREVVDMESKWTMFKVSTAEAAARSCGQMVAGESVGGHQR